MVYLLNVNLIVKIGFNSDLFIKFFLNWFMPIYFKLQLNRWPHQTEWYIGIMYCLNYGRCSMKFEYLYAHSKV